MKRNEAASSTARATLGSCTMNARATREGESGCIRVRANLENFLNQDAFRDAGLWKAPNLAACHDADHFRSKSLSTKC